MRSVRLLAVAGSVFLPATTSEALNPDRAISQYVHEYWTAHQGAPATGITAITQTPNGYLWLGTQGEGLVRFDGVRFVPEGMLSKAFGRHIERIRTLTSDRDGRLWAGTAFGVAYLENGTWTVVDRGERLKAMGLTAASDGSVWYTRQWDGLVRATTRAITSLPLEGTVQYVTFDTEGAMWCGGYEGLWRIAGETRRRYLEGRGLPDAVVTGLHADRSGNVWVGTRKGLALLRDGEAVGHFTVRDGLAADDVSAILSDRDGNLWAGTSSGGLSRRRPDRFESFTHADGLTSNRVTSLHEDREGSLWIGTASGLNRMRDASIIPSGEPEGLGRHEPLSVVEDAGGQILVSSGFGKVRSIHNGSVRIVPGESSFDGPLFADPRGGVWSGQLNGLSLRRDGRSDLYPVEGMVTCIGRDASGIVFGTSNGRVFRLDGRVARAYRLEGGAPLGPEPFGLDYIWMIHTSADGTLWLATSHGIIAVREGRARRVWERGALAARSIFEDEDGTLWFGTDGGVVRIAGDSVATITSREGLPLDGIFHVLADARGGLWMGSAGGILRTSRQAVQSLIEGRTSRIDVEVFGVDDGMRTAEVASVFQPMACAARDGRLWFATASGLVTIDPDHLLHNDVPPPVVIEALLAEDKPLPMEGSPLVPAGTRRLTIHFNGLSLFAPRRVRFQYQLEGYDRDWVDGGTQRVAHYMNLLPGRYTFRVKAANDQGVWSEESAGLEFVFGAHFWQTWPFRLLLMVLTMGSAYGVYRRRVATAHASLDRVTRELAERTEGERKLQSLHTELRLALESGQMGTWSWSASTRSLSWSAEARRITKDLTEGFVGGITELRSFVHKDDLPVFDQGMAATLASPHDTPHVEVRLILPDAEERWFEFRGQAIEEATGIIGAVGTIADIDARRRAAGEREALLKELGVRNTELERFTYTVSHDLKSPLITIRGFLGFLAEDALAGRTERIKEDTARIVEATTRMQRLLDELLDLSRVGKWSAESEAFDGREAVEEAVALARGRIEASRASLEIEPNLPRLHGDRQRIVQVLQNLIDNAASFMGSQPAPRIVVAARSEGRWPVIAVKDNGVGIAPKYADRVFGLFEKLDARSPGTGVGLALVKRIVEHHGGRVWVESDGEGSGSTFCFTLPPPPDSDDDH